MNIDGMLKARIKKSQAKRSARLKLEGQRASNDKATMAAAKKKAAAAMAAATTQGKVEAPSPSHPETTGKARERRPSWADEEAAGRRRTATQGSASTFVRQHYPRYCGPKRAPEPNATKAGKRNKFPIVEKPGRARRKIPPRVREIGYEAYAYRQPRSDRLFSVEEDDRVGFNHFDDWDRRDDIKSGKT